MFHIKMGFISLLSYSWNMLYGTLGLHSTFTIFRPGALITCLKVCFNFLHQKKSYKRLGLDISVSSIILYKGAI